MKRYGRFLEDVKNDFKNAGRAYSECAKLGGTTNGIKTLSFDFASQVGFPEMLVGMDVSEDAVCIINSAGTIMMVSTVGEREASSGG
jgi:hypothetical protein